jgi:hypothetical protein
VSGYCSTRRRSTELHDPHVVAGETELLQGEFGGLVGRGAIAADGDRLPLELLAAGDGRLHHQLKRQLIGDAADEDDVGPLDGGGRSRRVAVLGDVDRPAYHGMGEGRAALHPHRGDIEPELFEQALFGRVIQRPRSHREAVITDPHLGKRRLLRRRPRGGRDGEAEHHDREAFHHLSLPNGRGSAPCRVAAQASSAFILS